MTIIFDDYNRHIEFHSLISEKLQTMIWIRNSVRRTYS